MKLHNMKLKIMVLIGLLLLLGGCSSKSDTVYQNSMQKGLDAIAEDNFSKAEGLFEVALDSKKSDVKAKAYLNQVQFILKADHLVKQNKIDEAVQSLDKSMKVKEGSKVIASKSKDKKETLLKFQENQKNYNTLLADAKNLNQSGDYQKSNEKLDELLKADLTQFAAVKDEAMKLKDSNNEAIKNAEIAQAQKEAQAKEAAAAQAQKDAQAKANAEAQANNPFAWAPGIKEKFENDIRQNGYIGPNDTIFYKDGYIGGDGQGYYGVYNQEDRYIVTVNVKTGWYHG